MSGLLLLMNYLELKILSWEVWKNFWLSVLFKSISSLKINVYFNIPCYIHHSYSHSDLTVCMPSHFSHVQLCDPVDCSLLGSSVHGILQARILEWIAMLFSRVSSQLESLVSPALADSSLPPAPNGKPRICVNEFKSQISFSPRHGVRYLH